MKKKNKGPILIVGMHRSGTSVVASIVYKLGVNLGSDLVGKSYANPTGHYEDKDFLNIHRKILWSSVSEWDSPPSRNKIAKAWEKYENKLIQLINNKSVKNKLWGWKEPRTCLFLSFYYKLLPNMKIIYCKRDINHVANSLVVRNKFNFKYSKKLAAFYKKSIEDFFEEAPNVPVLEIEFQEVINNPRKVCVKLGKFIDIPFSDKVLSLAISGVHNKKELNQLTESLNYWPKMFRKSVLHPSKVFIFIGNKIFRFILRIKWRINN